MKSVFRSVDLDEKDVLFEQKAIDDDEETPEGWTEDFEDLDLLEEEPTEMESMKQQVIDLQDIVSQFSGGV
ncbi:hypothetical protein [Tetragenococcus halophilus]|uniref:Uncharacterized protein n=1 Tax=Tetragenococcus halophilus TaxID=51669 RepID=A0AB35HQK0_TETHA|nr:hypothetical protein [Tetragenococcus halophilus]MCO8298458.1 hypothetical protein [Tetragenococcus halophilus]